MESREMERKFSCSDPKYIENNCPDVLARKFSGFIYYGLSLTHPRIKSLQDGVIRVSGMSYWKGPAWVILMSQAMQPDDDLYARFDDDKLAIRVVEKNHVGTGWVDLQPPNSGLNSDGLNSDGLKLLRVLLPPRERDLFELGIKVGANGQT